MNNTTSNTNIRATLALFATSLLLTASAIAAPAPQALLDAIDLSNLAVSDDDNTPINVAPGHTAESFCDPSVNENHIGQLDLTDTFISIDGDILELVSFYNGQSAASTTEQYWFLDTDMNPNTGGGDNVSVPGPGASANPHCIATLPVMNASGYEAYIHSSGPNASNVAVFLWDGNAWVEVALPFGAVNVQDKADNPTNAYTGDNGFRGVSGLSLAELGISGDFELYTRSFSSLHCCGDDNGGQGPLTVIRWTCPATLCGDCDMNGFVNVLDALKGAQHGVQLLTLEGAAFSNCNTYGIFEPAEGALVDILDALMIARYAVGLQDLDCCLP